MCHPCGDARTDFRVPAGLLRSPQQVTSPSPHTNNRTTTLWPLRILRQSPCWVLRHQDRLTLPWGPRCGGQMKSMRGGVNCSGESRMPPPAEATWDPTPHLSTLLSPHGSALRPSPQLAPVASLSLLSSHFISILGNVFIISATCIR
jgi:hypothetical protein